MPPASRRAPASDPQAGPSSSAPRADVPVWPASVAAQGDPHRPGRFDLNARPPRSPRPTGLDLNVEPPRSPAVAGLDLNFPPPRSPRPTGLDLNAAPPGSPAAGGFDLNVPPPRSPRPTGLDLNAAPPGSPVAGRFDLNVTPPASPEAPSRPLDSTPAGAPAATPPAQDPAAAGLATGAAAMAHFGIQGMPRPADLIRVLELLPEQADPRFESLVIRACEEMIVQMGSSEELLQALDDRYAANPVMSNAINQIMDHILAIEDFSGASHSHSSEDSDGLAADLEQQTAALGEEIRAWTMDGDNASAAAAQAFDDEPNARPFARLLSRLRERRDDGTSSSAAEQLTTQVSAVIAAIAADAGLRAQVFLIAESALGTCGDNLAEGFSNVVLAVNNHQMSRAVENGSVGVAELHDWAEQQMRLSLLEGAVNRFIADTLRRPDLPRSQRQALTREPLETMVHAKMALRERLDLPESTVSTMSFRTCSVLTEANLEALARQVGDSSADAATRDAFLLGNATWRAGMKAAHPEAFAALARERDDDPFHDLDLPSTVEEQTEYAGRARAVEAEWARREDALLLSLAASDRRPGPHPAKPEAP